MLASNFYETSVFRRQVSSVPVLSAWAVVGDAAGSFCEIMLRFAVLDFVDSNSATTIVNLDFHQDSLLFPSQTFT